MRGWLPRVNTVVRGSGLLTGLLVLAAAGCDESRPVERAQWPECSRCHGSFDTPAPPKDLFGSDDPTERGVGAHEAHLLTNRLSAPVACTACHVVPADTDAPGHTDDAWPAEVTFSGLAVAQGAAPTLVAPAGSHKAGEDRALEVSCNAVYCHGATLHGGRATQPSWNRPDLSFSQCDACHGAPPPAPHPASAECQRCHAATAGPGLTLAHAERHVDGHLDVEVTCTSCHGDAARAATAVNPQLAAAPPTGTHGETLTSERAVGAHQAHLTDGAFSRAFACTECHQVPTSTGHTDGTVDIHFGPRASARGALPTWDGAGCAATYCHGQFRGGSTATPTWTGSNQAACGSCHGLPPAGSHPQNPRCELCHPGYTQATVDLDKHVNGAVDVLTLSCTACHGDATRAPTALNPQLAAAPPQGTHQETQTSERAVGAHQAHLTDGSLRGALACTECHQVPTDNGHSNGSVDLSWGTLARTGNVTPQFTGTTCSATYCHGNFRNGAPDNAPAWTGTGGAPCGSCHGLPPGGTHPQGNQCGMCHAGYTATTVNLAQHINGTIDVATLSCTSCHGDAARPPNAVNPQLAAAPPAGVHGEDQTSDRAVGAHQAHLVAGSLRGPVACAECHQVPTSNVHSNGSVELHWGALATKDGAAPQWNGTGCAATYCHGNFVNGNSSNTPAWTEPNQAQCGSCHGLPPGGSHPQNSQCALCHAGYSASTVDMVKHMDGHVDAISMSCTACHGDATRDATATNPQLAAAPPRGVHGEDQVSQRAVGAHQAHLKDGPFSRALACSECHQVPTSGAHANGQVELNWGSLATHGGAAPQWDGASCSATYCHGSFPGGTAANAPAWTQPDQAACGSCHGLPPGGTHPAKIQCGVCHAGYTASQVNLDAHLNGNVDIAITGCTACHGDANRAATAVNPQLAAAPPQGTHGETAVNQRAVGAHQAHLRDSYLRPALACTECHALPTNPLHANGSVELTWGTLAITGGAVPQWNGTTCSATYCHGNFRNGEPANAPSWTEPGPAQCGSCHALPPGGTHPNAGANPACGSCHPGATAFTMDKAIHMDGKVDILGLSCTMCHGDGNRAATTANPQLPAAPPRGTSGETATTERAVGAHQAHLVDNAFAKPVACAECHAVPATPLHSDGTVQVQWGAVATTGGTAPQWNGATCSATYCHGGFPNGATDNAPSWTGSNQAACGSCHGLPPGGSHPNHPDCAMCHDTVAADNVTMALPLQHVDGVVQLKTFTCHSCHGSTASNAPPTDTHGQSDPTQVSVGAHQAHLSTTLGATVACSACHVVPASTFAAGHIDPSPAEVQFSGVATADGAAPQWDRSAATCSATYCHGSTLGGGTLTTPTWTALDGSQAQCGTCHGLPPPAPHPQAANCSACHGATMGSSDTQVANKQLHVDGDVQLSAAGCTVCHGSGTDPAPPKDTAGGSATSAVGVGAHQAHLHATLSPPVACTECHVVPATLNAPGHLGALAAELSFGTLAKTGGANPAWSHGAATCSATYCHGSTLGGGTLTVPSWTTVDGTQDACGTCHGLAPSTGQHGRSPHRSAGCGVCHGDGYAATTTTKTVNAALHVNGAKDVGGAGSQITTWNPSSRSCRPTCHGSETW